MTNTGKQIFIIVGFLAALISLFLLLWCLRGSLPVAGLDAGDKYIYGETYCTYEKYGVTEPLNNLSPAHCHWDDESEAITTCPRGAYDCYTGNPDCETVLGNSYFRDIPDVTKEENIVIRVYPGDDFQ